MTDYRSGFRTLAADYDAFILDLWGVIHDGQHPYPGARKCLESLHAEGKKIVLLSNAPRRAHMAEAALLRMGVPPACYDAILTSGEAAYRCLATGNDPYFTPVGKCYIYIGLEKDRTLLEGLDYSVSP